jgi:hypothetical protein
MKYAQLNYFCLRIFIEMKNCILIIILASLGVLETNAQSYTTAVGVRGGLAYGVTAKHFLNENIAVEAIASMRWRGAFLTGLLEYHEAIPEVDGLSWFAGAGGHVGFWNTYYYSSWDTRSGTYAMVGLDIIGGLDMDLSSIADIPVDVSVDWKPQVNFSNGWVGFWPFAGAVSARYIIK